MTESSSTPPASTSEDGASMFDIFELDEVRPNTFIAPNPAERAFGRVFGGQVVAQSLRAAQLTVPPDRLTNSLHAYFIRGGKPGEPIRLEVNRIRDGRSFTTRLVEAYQGDDAIFSMSCSFHIAEDGPEWQLPISNTAPGPDEARGEGEMEMFRRMMTEGPPKEMLDQMPPQMRKEFEERRAAMIEAMESGEMPDGGPHGGPRGRRGGFHGHGPGRFGIESREVGPTEPDERGVYESTRRTWMRIPEPIGDDLSIHQCVLAFMSDMGAAMGARVPHLQTAGHGMGGASLDHAMWFHRAGRADDWVLMDLHAVSVSGARGFTRGTIHSADGTLIASITQEALQRPTGRMPF